MLRVTLWTIFLLIGFAPDSYAGFEWLPPEKNPANTGASQFDFPVLPPEVADKMITPMYQNTAVERAPLTAPLNTPASDPFMAHKSNSASAYSNYQTNTQQPTMARQMGVRSPQSTTASQQRPVSLYIDPYPMGQESVNTNAREIRASSIEQAMMERANKVTPMAMGSNLETGAQMAYAQTPTVQTPINNPIGGMSPSTMAPIGTMGGIQTGPMNAMPTRQYAQAVGFGNDLPLALALSQVIPPEFAHSFALGVDPGTTVSWQGGKPWNLVLEDMLRPQGLTATVKQNTVTIQPLMSL